MNMLLLFLFTAFYLLSFKDSASLCNHSAFSLFHFAISNLYQLLVLFDLLANNFDTVAVLELPFQAIKIFGSGYVERKILIED